MKHKSKLLIVVALALGFTILGKTHTAFACPGPAGGGAGVPNYIPCSDPNASPANNIDGDLYNYDHQIAQNPSNNCYTNPYLNPLLDRWLSPVGSSTQDRNFTLSGSGSVSLMLNGLMMACQRFVSPSGTYYPRDGSSSQMPQKYVMVINGTGVSGGSGTFTGPAPGTSLTITGSTATRYWYNTLSGFTFSTSTSNGTFTVYVIAAGIVYWGGTPYCAATGNPAPGGPPSYGCPNETLYFTFNASTPTPPPQLRITQADCSAVVGQASDPGNAENVTVTLNMGGTPHQPIVGMAAGPDNAGYWMAGTDGGVFAFGDAQFYGSLGGISLAAPIVGISRTASGRGYRLVGADGGVFGFGDGNVNGSLPGLGISKNNIVGMATDYANNGYWLVGSDGSVYALNGAPYLGGASAYAVQPIVGIAATPDGGGYWLVNKYGQVYAYGDAQPKGNAPGGVSNIVGVEAGPDSGGYWLVGSDGGVFTFGDASFYGSMGGQRLAAPISGVARTPSGRGYWLVGQDSGVFNYGDALFEGNLYGYSWTATATPGGVYWFNFPSSSTYLPFVTNTARTFTITANDNGGTVSSGPFNIGPCGSVQVTSCSLTINNNNSPEPSASFPMDLYLNYSSTGTQTVSGIVTVSVNGVGTVYSQSINQQVSNGSGTLHSPPGPANVTVNSAGRYTAIMTFSGTGGAVCSKDFVVVDKPYFKVFDGDVSAGINPSACTNWPGSTTGAIYGYNKGDGGAASTQLAALAMGAIDGFTSATGRVLPGPPTGLSFANQSGLFGGSLSGTMSCPPWFTAPSGATDPGSSINTANLSAGKYYHNGAVTISTGNVPMGVNKKKIEVFVDGDVFIHDNLTYSTSNWNNLGNIQNVYIIANGGNIYIDSSVTELDGVYVAQPTSDGSRGGNIYTCADAGNPSLPFTGDPQGFIATTCQQNQLTVYGAFLAQTVKLLRSSGTQQQGSAGENPYGGARHAAEMFIFSPDVWLTSPATSSGSNEVPNYDSATALSPLL